ncbi:MAG: type II toxin-antitoxin system CcdA family antitoxin [Pseudomonadota bacterium]
MKFGRLKRHNYISHLSPTSTLQRTQHLILNEEFTTEVEPLKINQSKAEEIALRKAVVDAKSEQWKKENRKAMESTNQWVEENGLPFTKYRQF